MEPSSAVPTSDTSRSGRISASAAGSPRRTASLPAPSMSPSRCPTSSISGAEILARPGDAISLVRTDGEVLARYPVRPNALTRLPQAESPLMRAPATERPEVPVRGISSTDGAGAGVLLCARWAASDRRALRRVRRRRAGEGGGGTRSCWARSRQPPPVGSPSPCCGQCGRHTGWRPNSGVARWSRPRRRCSAWNCSVSFPPAWRMTSPMCCRRSAAARS